MNNCSPVLYFDRENHTWKFYINNSDELMYSIMYEEDKWTKETKIDNKVLDFAVNIDSNNKINLIYSNREGKLKYCIMENAQCFSKTLYRFEDETYQLNVLDAKIIGENLHIFSIAKNYKNKKQCSLMHFCWNNEKNSFNTICNISYVHEEFSRFQTEVPNNESLYLFFINYVNKEITIKLTEYKNKSWSTPKKLYGINGKNIDFCTLQHNGNINILNLSKESSRYSLEHVLIESDERLKSYKIYESSVELKNYSLLEINGVLWVTWSEGENYFASSYKDKWNKPVKYNNELSEPISLHKYLSLSKKYKNIKAKYVLATMPPEIKLFLPQYTNSEYANTISENSEEDIINQLGSTAVENNPNNEDELMTLKKSNKNLEKKLLDSQLQLQQKQRIIQESDGNFIKLTNTKKKIEERLNIITEIQQTLVKELQETKKQKLELDNVVNELKNKLHELINENDQLKKELKYELNMGLVDRILKKKPQKKHHTSKKAE